MDNKFPGFPKEMERFFKGLAKNNTKEWFDAHRGEYDEYVQDPARAFVTALGNALEPIAPDVHAIPQVNKSLFRINRDVRFSKDKSPYKTNMGIFLWEGTRRKRMECSGFYFHWEPKEIFVGVGMHTFPQDLLERYREILQKQDKAKELKGIVDELSRLPGVTIGGEHYKRTPRGFEATENNEKLLLHSGLYASHVPEDRNIVFTDRFLSYCVDRYKQMLPLHRWLVENLP